METLIHLVSHHSIVVYHTIAGYGEKLSIFFPYHGEMSDYHTVSEGEYGYHPALVPCVFLFALCYGTKS